MTPSDFKALATEIAKLNDVDISTAEDWLVLIGDTPEYVDDTSDLVLLPDDSGRTIHWPLD